MKLPSNFVKLTRRTKRIKRSKGYIKAFQRRLTESFKQKQNATI